MLIEKQLAWPLWSSSRAVVNSASSFSKSPRCFTLQITHEVETKQCERLDESFIPVALVLRHASAPKSRSSASDESSGTSCCPKSTGGFVIGRQEDGPGDESGGGGEFCEWW